MIKRLFWLTLITTPILLGIMIWHGAALQTVKTPYGIIDAEFASTIQRVKIIYAAWYPQLLQHAKVNTYIDFFFLLSYGLFLFSAADLIRFHLGPFLKTIGKVVAFAFLFAAVLDAIENIGILLMLNRIFNPVIIAITPIAATIKFSLIFTGLFYLLAGSIQYLFFRK